VIAEVGAEDLAMGAEEASWLLEGAGVEPGVAGIHELVQRTEGWPAGLYIAALAIKAGTRQSEVGFTFTGRDRFMGGYLRSELLDRVSGAEVSLLTRTSVLDRMCGPLDAAVALAHAWLAAGDPQAARQALASAAAGSEAPDFVRLEGWLIDARLSYGGGDRARGRRSLENALLLGEHEHLRLPFAMERTWIRPALQRDPDLAHAYRHLLELDVVSPGWVPARQPGTMQSRAPDRRAAQRARA
jgi:ATP/maltotriose-dependent transcriptional regulator MalT